MNHSFFDWLDSYDFLGIALTSWCVSAVSAIAFYLVAIVLLRLLGSRLERRAANEGHAMAATMADLVAGTSRGLLLLAALFVGAGLLDLPARWQGRLDQLWFVAVALQLGLWGMRAVLLGVQRYEGRHSSPGMTQVSASATLMLWGLRTLLWTILLLAILSNLGVNITAFVTSLGVGGIAIALAVQSILSDIFASLSIAVDKPFRVGDTIAVGDTTGQVQVIGLKTTRIRSLRGEEVVMSNTELLKQTINNYGLMKERRIVFTFGVTYDLTPEQAERIPAVLRQLVEGQERLRFDRAHFRGFGESSLDFELVYYVLDRSYGIYMDMQQAINLGLMRELAAMGVEFAFPTRTLHVATLPAGAEPPAAAPEPVPTLPPEPA